MGRDGRKVPRVLKLDARERTYVLPVDYDLSHVRVDPGYRLLAEISISAPESWLQALSRDPDPVLALRAARALMGLGTLRAQGIVREALASHPFYGLRGALAAEIASPGTETACEVLVAALKRETDPRARKDIAAALGAFRRKEAADALLELLTEPTKSWHLRGAALLSLGQTRDPRARDILVAELSRDSWSDWLRQQALKGLAELKDPSLMPLLLENTGPSGSDKRRAAAATAIGALAGEHRDLRKAAVDCLSKLAQSGPFPAQMAAIAALGGLQDPAALPALGIVHRTAPDGRTRRAAFEASAKITRGKGSDEAIAALRQRLDALSEENTKLKQRIERLER